MKYFRYVQCCFDHATYMYAQTSIAQEFEIKFFCVRELPSLRRSIRSSYVYRVFRLIDSELHVTRLKTRYLWNSGNVWRGPLSICPRWLVTRRFARPGKSALFLSLHLPPESQGKRAIPAKFAGGSFDLWRKFLIAALLRWISWSCCSPFSRSRLCRAFSHPFSSFFTLNPSFDRAPSGWEIAGGPAFWHRRSTGLIDFLRPASFDSENCPVTIEYANNGDVSADEASWC